MRPKAIALAATLVLTAGGLSTATLGSPNRPCEPDESACVLAPPAEGQAYHAAFPDFGGREDQVEPARLERFESAAARPVTWAYFSNNWFRGRVRFPSADVETIAAAERVPFVRLMARSGYGPGADENFSMRSIAAGEWDPELRGWCRDAAAAEVPLLAEFGTEVNGDWFPWNGRWNGGGSKAWGDPSLADGPERFRAAYRRIVETCDAQGADDITWFFHADVGGWPEAAWNEPWDYYPGDDVIDWIGLSDYGPLRPGEPWRSFRSRMDGVIGELTSRLGEDKPLAVLEYGAAAAPTASQQARKARWIERAAALVGSGRWPQIRALAYWHESWQNANGSVSDLHIDSSRRVREAYRAALGGDEFSTTPEFVAR
jgi:hypothetical protein